MRLQSGGGGTPLKPLLHTRGKVTIWSEESRTRFRDRLAETDWPNASIYLATATYPRYFEADPAAWKADLHRLFVAWRQTYGPVRCVWILEFQRRGAPHFHIAIVVPNGVKSAEVREWFAQTWYRIAGHGDRRHLNQHRKAEHFKRTDGHRGVTSYFQRELRKEHQKTLPEWLRRRDSDEGAGRWWGVRGLKRLILDEPVTEAESYKLKRVASRLMHGRDDDLIAKLRADRGQLVDEVWEQRGGIPSQRDREERRRIGRALRRVVARRAWPGWKWRGMKLYDRTPSPWGLADRLYWYLRLVRCRCRAGDRCRCGHAPPAHGSLAAMELRATEQLRIGPPITMERG